MTMLGSPYHLMRRFFFSVFANNYDSRVEKDLLSLLNDYEISLYLSQPRIDRVHSIRNAKSVFEEDSTEFDGDLVVAAALHDVGKAQSHLGILGRILATILQGLLPVRVLKKWEAGEGLRKNIGHYCFHSEIGADLLEKAGSASIVVLWARRHHDKPDDVPISANVFAILNRADQK